LKQQFLLKHCLRLQGCKFCVAPDAHLEAVIDAVTWKEELEEAAGGYSAHDFAHAVMALVCIMTHPPPTAASCIVQNSLVVNTYALL
jgi:hypothetical protein